MGLLENVLTASIKGMVSFITGWMVHPSGEIRLVTPYGGK